jgi:hypothetical protein
MSVLFQAQIDVRHRGREVRARRLCSLAWDTPHRAGVLLILLLLTVGSGSLPRVRARQPLQWVTVPPPIRSLDSALDAGVRGNREAGLQALQPALVRLEHQSVRLGPDRRPIPAIAKGSGTVVGPHTILTHGHYRPFGDPAYVHEALVVTLPGSSLSASVDVNRTATPYVDAGTILLVLPNWMRLPEAVALGDPEGLRAGDAVFVAHWDDVRGRFALLETTVASVKGRVARIEDPGRTLQPGDSGGGVYNVRGELVGNVWSIGMSGTGQRLPWFEAALLPVGAGQYVR